MMHWILWLYHYTMYACIKASLCVPQICIIMYSLEESVGDEKAGGLEEKYIFTVIFWWKKSHLKKMEAQSKSVKQLVFWPFFYFSSIITI